MLNETFDHRQALYEAALADRELGPIIPLIGKQPAVSNWQKFDPTDENCRYYFLERGCNLGMRTGRYVVFDADTDSAKQWLVRRGIESPSIVLTGSGTEHHYFQECVRKVVRNYQGLHGIQGLDIRGAGGLVVRPPSIHPGTGKPYQSVTPLLAATDLPRFSPRWVYQRTRQKLKEIEDVGDIDFMERRARAWIDHVEGAVSGAGGHNATMRVAGKLIQKFQLDIETALRVMQSWNERCEPSWSEKELRWKLHSAVNNRHRYSG